MIRTRIEYGTHSWSPIRGCKHGLDVCPTAATCWARSIATRFHKSFEPTFHPEVLKQPLTLRHPEGSRILVCFTGDLGGAWVPQSWQKAVIDIIRQCPIPDFLLLTKNPLWFAEFNPWPENAWVGTSLTGAETPERQAAMLEALRLVEGPRVKWLSLEPLLGEIDLNQRAPMEISFVVIGAQSGRGAISPKIEWIESLEAYCRIAGIPYWQKHNLAHYLKRPLIQEMP